MEAIAFRLEAIAIRLKDIANRNSEQRKGRKVTLHRDEKRSRSGHSGVTATRGIHQGLDGLRDLRNAITGGESSEGRQ